MRRNTLQLLMRRLMVGVSFLLLGFMCITFFNHEVWAKDSDVISSPTLTFSANPLDSSCIYSSLEHNWSCWGAVGRSDDLQGDLPWMATSTPGIIISPASGVLPSGGSALVTVYIPEAVCPTSFSLSFVGPSNTVTVPWKCKAPAFALNKTDLTASSDCSAAEGGWNCAVDISELAGERGDLSWIATASQNLAGIKFTPASGVLKPGDKTAVGIFIPQASCQEGHFHFIASGGKTLRTLWHCQPTRPAPPTLTVTPNRLSLNDCVNKGFGQLECGVTLSETADSKGSAHWQASSSLFGVVFSPAEGTLAPGQSVTVKFSFTCQAQTGTFTFKGSEGEAPVVVSWTVAACPG